MVQLKRSAVEKGRQGVYIVKYVILKMSGISQIVVTVFWSEQKKRDCIWKDCGFE